ncbi:protein kinase [Nocardia sp. NPDC006630]|uniref:protein kinase domain-containing protein n=1 Tax=Nocardia sp. NPDC006630 TaxID=3157181 RepID=UPI00339E4484
MAAQLGAAGFEVDDEIGHGGFGMVYRCVQAGLKRTVAVKVLTEPLSENRERFIREQQAMGQLTGHPNIVGVLQVGETEGGYQYLVMPYCRCGSLEARIREHGPMPLADVLRLGVKMTGALETAHRAGILHRDIKPGNILYTDYGEPALSDFGIAHVTGAFETETGTFTGSPAFTAPETLSGDPPSKASDVYGLGSTLFCALTGHAAFERHRGEQVVTQFLRIATEPTPDPRGSGIPDDVATVIEGAMARGPQDRPSILLLGSQLRQLQDVHGFAVDDMALPAEVEAANSPPHPVARARFRSTLSNLPRELTSFVGRSEELAALQSLMTEFPLVTVTGIGGIGKTRLALRAAAQALDRFPDGVRLVEMGELRDGSAVVDLVAARLGLCDDGAGPLVSTLIEYLSSRTMLLVLDNCEQVLDAAAELVESLLCGCPDLRVLATSREGMRIPGEALLALAPLGEDAVTLFAERVAAAVPGATLIGESAPTVAKICSRLDGLPLAIELAAAELRTLSPEQILQRLDNRYALLTRGRRGAPRRQQSLAWSIGWSYDLCTPAEQQLWARLSVFAGSFELEAAEDVCGTERVEDVLDPLSALVDKSILIRTESHGAVRFRLLETVRDFGREKLGESGEDAELRRRHLAWARRVTGDFTAAWFGPQQIDWIRRLDRELPNLREAMEFGLSAAPSTASRMAISLFQFFAARGLLGEGRRWLDRALAAQPAEPPFERVETLYCASLLASDQGDPDAAAAFVQQARALLERLTDPEARALVDIADGFVMLLRGNPELARIYLDAAVAGSAELVTQATALTLLARAHESRGDAESALVCNQRILEISGAHGESVSRAWALWSVGIELWRRGERDNVARLIDEGLELAHSLQDVRGAASFLEVLAWVAAEEDQPGPAAIMLAAAETLGGIVQNYAFLFPNLPVFHEECEQRVRNTIDPHEYDVARETGRSLSFDDAIGYARSVRTSSW